MLMEEKSYPAAFLAEVLSRLLPEKVAEETILFHDNGGLICEDNPRQAALRVVKKIAVEEIPGSAFGNALYWALHLLRRVKEYGDWPLPALETTCMVAGLNGVLVDFFGEIDQVETAMNYELPEPEEETGANFDWE